MEVVVIITLGKLRFNIRVTSGGLHDPVTYGDYKHEFFNTFRTYQPSAYKSQSNWKRSLSPKKRNTKQVPTFARKKSGELEYLSKYLNEMDKRLSMPKHKVEKSSRSSSPESRKH